MTEHDDSQERRAALIQFVRLRWNTIIHIIVALIIYWGYKIRTSNLGLLKDVTTGKFIPLALDPYLFLRYAKTIALEGSLPVIDTLRYAPFGWNTGNDPTLISYFSVYLYKFVGIFSSSFTIEEAHILHPAIAYVMGSIMFFLLIKRIFNVNIAALATLILTLIPTYLYRTMAGFSDKESLAMFLLFTAMYLYVVGMQSEKTIRRVFFGALSGLVTLLLQLSWGGVKFLFLIMGIYVIIEILLDKFSETDFYQYSAWFVAVLLVVITHPDLLGYKTLLFSFTSGAMVIAFVIALIDYILFTKDWFGIKKRMTGKLPHGVSSILVAMILSIIVLIAIQGPGVLVERADSLYTDLTRPFGKDRWQLTVAEQHQPFITSWLGQMGGISFMMLYIAGAVGLFFETLRPLKNIRLKNEVINYIAGYAFLALVYFLYIFQKTQSLLSLAIIVVLCGYAYWTYKKGIEIQPTMALHFLSFLIFFIFSRYDQNNALNGTNTTSLVLYIGSLVMLVVGLLGAYLVIYYNDIELYHRIRLFRKEAIFILIWFVIAIVGARGAARLLFFFSPIVSLLVAYACIRPIEIILSKNVHNAWKICIPIFLILLVASPVALGSLGKGFILNFKENTVEQAKYTGPSYHQQWQYAGQWMRDSTPKDAIFAHWWDYGYWVQTGGERATVTDGGNNIGAWNYQIGRHVLTGKTTQEALEVLYAHNATHLLIIADEIGKYTAYSSIGSDENYDRYSQINTFVLQPQHTRETRNSTEYLFQGGWPLDEDTTIDGKFYPAGGSGIGGFFLPTRQESIINDDGSTSQGLAIMQPRAGLVHQGSQAEVPIGCIYFNGQVFQFPSQLEGCLRIIPVIQNNQLNPLGAALWVSKRGIDALWTQVFLFDQKLPGKEHKPLELAYDDSDRMPLALLNGRLIGPLRIWKVNYPENFTMSDELYKLYQSAVHENPAATVIGRGFGR